MKMVIKASRPLIVAGMLFVQLLSNQAVADTGQDRDMRPTLGFDLGYFLPVGDWAAHRYAPGVDQFGGGLVAGGEFEASVAQFGLVLFGSHTRLGLDDWTSYSSSMGDAISASASFSSVGFLIRLYLLRSIPNFLDLGLGLGYFGFNGQESFASFSYDYNFLSSGLGIIGELGYKRLLGPNVALTLSTKAVLVPDGVEYADGPKYDVVGFPITLGIRYIL